MQYTALEVARFIINHFTKNGNPITNLKLQKILYFVWIDYYKNTEKELFPENFIAWPYGPVVKEVYFEYSVYAGTPINETYTTNIRLRDTLLLNKLIDKYSEISARQLVDDSHTPGAPWANIYQNGEGKDNIIPFSLMEKYATGECNDNRR